MSEAEDTWKRKHAATTMQIASMQDQLDVGEKEREKMEEALNQVSSRLLPLDVRCLALMFSLRLQAVQAKKQTAKECDELQEKLKEAASDAFALRCRVLTSRLPLPGIASEVCVSRGRARGGAGETGPGSDSDLAVRRSAVSGSDIRDVCGGFRLRGAQRS